MNCDEIANLSLNIPCSEYKRLVIVGGGFAGIELLNLLCKKKIQVVLIDKNNYHTFQPLLYQVASGGLEPDSIAFPLRRSVRKGKNMYFRMAEVYKVMPDVKQLDTSRGILEYDYLVIATGSQTNYFGLDRVKFKIMGMKTIPDALDLRSYVLQNFESSLMKSNDAEKEERLNIVIVGGGPTGVELAGAFAEMKRYIIPHDYPEIDLDKMKIWLIEGTSKLLGGLSAQASVKAYKYLSEMGINVILNSVVQDYDGHILKYGENESLQSTIVIWTAGVQGLPVSGLENAILPGKRLKVNLLNQVDGYENIFALGDVAGMLDDEYPKGHPMVAPVAIQQAKLFARNIFNLIENKPLKPFHYKNQGTMATVGRNKAVVDTPNFRFQGVLAWYVWMFIQLMAIAEFRNRMLTFTNWIWNFFTYERAYRLIIRPYKRPSTIK
jgi:NADH:ubiquinone reductase (H+-translocating)